jgi:predicted nucleic acid-binding protein
MRVVIDTNYKAGRLVNQVRKLAEDVDTLPRVERSSDPTDDFLLSVSEGGKADYLVTGDKSGLLTLGRHKATRIVSAKEFAGLFV